MDAELVKVGCFALETWKFGCSGNCHWCAWKRNISMVKHMQMAEEFRGREGKSALPRGDVAYLRAVRIWRRCRWGSVFNRF